MLLQRSRQNRLKIQGKLEKLILFALLGKENLRRLVKRFASLRKRLNIGAKKSLYVGSINYHRNKQQNNMGYVLPSFGLFSVHIATSFGRNARIAPLLADDMYSKIVSKSSKANL